jgi:hypothetical protein
LTVKVPNGSYERVLALKESDPEQFRKLMLALSKITLKPHAGQKIVLASEARYKVMNCGRRWGKTKLAAHIFTKKARKPNQMLWWVAPTYKVVKRGYVEVLSQLPDGVLTHEPPPDTNFDAGRSVILRFKNGTRMEFYSAERPEGMLGAGVDYAVLDEAAIMPMRIFNQIVRPTLMDRRGGALMISTPRGRNWFYKVYQLGQDPNEKEFESWTFESWTNPTLPEGEVESMRQTMPRLEFQQEVEAKFLAEGSSVFIVNENAIQRAEVFENGLVEGYAPAGQHVFLGVDLARTNDYTVLYGTREKDRRNVYFERMQAIAWAEQRRRIARAVRRLMKSGAESVTLMVDEGNAGSVIVEDLQEAGFDVVGINFTTHKGNMVRLLANDLERGRAFVLDEMISEFEDYGMSITPAGRITYSAPEGDHDDVVSAKMLSHWGCVNEGMGDVTILSADSVADLSEGNDPWDAEDDEGDFSDLIDDDMTDGEAFEAIGLPDPTRRPTEAELLQSPDLWF